MTPIKTKLCIALAGLALLGTSQVSKAALIPYQNIGTANAATYTFVAASTGPVTAYFAGSTAGYRSVLGMSINGQGVGNGTSTGFGLSNDAPSPWTAVGTPYVLGTANAGDTLTFVLQLIAGGLNTTPVGQLISSDPSANVTYDGGVVPGNQHVYSTPYTDGSLGAGIPNGTYVAFEDLAANVSNFDYFDHTFVFENVAVPEPSTYLAGALLALVFGVQGFRTLRNRKQA
jgi:hypothetical protein